MVKVLNNDITLFFMVPEVKRTICVSLRKLFFPRFITKSAISREEIKPQTSEENTKYEIQRGKNSS